MQTRSAQLCQQDVDTFLDLARKAQTMGAQRVRAGGFEVIFGEGHPAAAPEQELAPPPTEEELLFASTGLRPVGEQPKEIIDA